MEAGEIGGTSWDAPDCFASFPDAYPFKTSPNARPSLFPLSSACSVGEPAGAAAAFEENSRKRAREEEPNIEDLLARYRTANASVRAFSRRVRQVEAHAQAIAQAVQQIEREEE